MPRHAIYPPLSRIAKGNRKTQLLAPNSEALHTAPVRVRNTTV